jgi:hypothetical protein
MVFLASGMACNRTPLGDRSADVATSGERPGGGGHGLSLGGGSGSSGRPNPTGGSRSGEGGRGGGAGATSALPATGGRSSTGGAPVAGGPGDTGGRTSAAGGRTGTGGTTLLGGSTGGGDGGIGTGGSLAGGGARATGGTLAAGGALAAGGTRAAGGISGEGRGGSAGTACLGCGGTAGSSGVDGSSDGALPGDPDASIAECATALPLSCGDTVDHSTLLQGRPNLWSSYPEAKRLASGRETVYVLETHDPIIILSLTNLTTDLDVFFLSSCAPSSRFAPKSPTVSQSSRSYVFWTVAPGTYYVVVDGYDGAAGSYTLGVDCTY